MKVAELFAEVGFKFDSIKLREVGKLLGDLNLSSIIGATSLTALGLKIVDVMGAASKASVALLNLKQATGLDPVRLQQLDVYFQKFGASAGEAQQALYNLNKLRLEVLQGKGDPQAFILTGLLPTTDTLKLLDQIHEKFSDTSFLKNWAGSFAQGAQSLQEMRAAWKDMIANQFGIPSSMLRGLDQSNEKWREMSKILALNEEEIRLNAEVHEKWVASMNDLNVEIQKVVTNLTPIAIEVLKIVDAVVILENKFQVLGGFIERLKIIGTFTKAAAADFNNSILSKRDKFNRFLNPVPANSPAGQSMKQTNNVTVHVNANNPEEFVTKFDSVFKKYLSNADIQFGQQR